MMHETYCPLIVDDIPQALSQAHCVVPCRLQIMHPG